VTTAISSASVFVGVDTHADIHHAAVVDPLGRDLADHTFATTPAGYEDLERWCAQFGDIVAVGIEGTSSYGAGLSRRLRAGGMRVVEVDRPDRKSRRLHGKTDALDAYSAARAVAAGRASAVPKAKDGLVESIRSLHVARRSAVKARTQAINQIRGLIITGPLPLREQTRALGTKALITTVARLRPAGDPADPCDRGQDRRTRPRPALSESQRGDRAPRRAPRHADRTGRPSPTRAPRSRCRHRRPAAHHRRRQPRAVALRSRLRTPDRKSHRSPHHRAAPIATGSAAAETAKPTGRCTPSSWSACTATRRPRTTCDDAPSKDSARRTSSAASNAPSPARSTASSKPPPQTPPWPRRSTRPMESRGLV